MKTEELLVGVAMVLLALAFMLSPGEKQIAVDFGVVAPVEYVMVYRNVTPVAVFDVSSDLCGAPCKVHFDASGSHDTDGYIVSYEWDFGDGCRHSESEPICSEVDHWFINDGFYQVILVVTDNRGAMKRYSEWVTIRSRLPTARFTGSVGFCIDGYALIELDASCSSDDGYIANYQWTTSGWRIANEKRVRILLECQSRYNITLTVIDNDGNQRSFSKWIYAP